jgi:phosphoglycolate phosphatase
MATPVRAVLFDLDGTLVDSAPDIAAAANRMLAQLEAPALAFDTIKACIGNGVPTLVRRLLAARGMDQRDYPRALALFERQYDATNGVGSRVFPGVVEGLSALLDSGLTLACVTNKPHAAAGVLLEKTGLARYFSAVVGGDSAGAMKPHPAPLLHACRLTGIERAATVLVGDSAVDVGAALAAPMPVYIVRYGYWGDGDQARLRDATLIDSLAQLPLLLAMGLAEKPAV